MYAKAKDRTERRGSCRATASNWSGSKKPVRTLFSTSMGMCGLWMSFPAWIARLNVRLRSVNSRLISPFRDGLALFGNRHPASFGPDVSCLSDSNRVGLALTP